MNIDFNFLSKSVGKRLLFETSFLLEDRSVFIDIFYAFLRKVDTENDFIIVEQYFVETDENYENEKIKSIKRRLSKGNFDISNTTPLNG